MSKGNVSLKKTCTQIDVTRLSRFDLIIAETVSSSCYVVRPLGKNIPAEFANNGCIAVHLQQIKRTPDQGIAVSHKFTDEVTGKPLVAYLVSKTVSAGDRLTIYAHKGNDREEGISTSAVVKLYTMPQHLFYQLVLDKLDGRL